VRMILRALDDPAWRGPVNAVAPDLVTQGQFTLRLAKWLRRPAFARAPAAPIRLALGPLADLFLASQRVLPAKAWSLGFTFERPTLELAFGERGRSAPVMGAALPVAAMRAEPIPLPVPKDAGPKDAGREAA
jgi:NAD dependent epimerase/dehydratase family enzyme